MLGESVTKNFLKLAKTAQAFTPALGRQRQADLRELKNCQNYMDEALSPEAKQTQRVGGWGEE